MKIFNINRKKNEPKSHIGQWSCDHRYQDTQIRSWNIGPHPFPIITGPKCAKFEGKNMYRIGGNVHVGFFWSSLLTRLPLEREDESFGYATRWTRRFETLKYVKCRLQRAPEIPAYFEASYLAVLSLRNSEKLFPRDFDCGESKLCYNVCLRISETVRDRAFQRIPGVLAHPVLYIRCIAFAHNAP